MLVQELGGKSDRKIITAMKSFRNLKPTLMKIDEKGPFPSHLSDHHSANSTPGLCPYLITVLKSPGST